LRKQIIVINDKLRKQIIIQRMKIISLLNIKFGNLELGHNIQILNISNIKILLQVLNELSHKHDV